MEYKKPLPKPNDDNRLFWEGCREHQLRFQKCGDCGHVRWPPSIICPICYSDNTDHITAGGRGTIFSFVVYHTAFHPAFEDDLPYVVAIVELEEGPRLLTNIVSCSHDELRCELAVEVVWDDITEDFSLPKFSPLS
jgi:uncharacterized OB-fold protein